MSQALHVIASNLPSGYGPSDGRCLPCSGISGRAVVVSPCASHGDHRIHSQFKIGSLKCASRGASFVCRANSSGHRRNPDFLRQNKHTYSRSRNRQNEERDSFGNLDESELLSSKNGPLLPLSSSPKFQATAAPGPREKEIVELFRKVQVQLRERAAIKEEKKIEALQGKGKESETVDSLLKLLRKHSVEQGKRKSSSISSRDNNLDQPGQNGPYYEDKSSSILGLNRRVRDEVQEPNATTLTRPPSNFRRKTPIPYVKHQPIYSGEDNVNPVSRLNSSEMRNKNQVEILPDPESAPEAKPGPEPESDLEQELEFKTEAIIADEDVFSDASDGESTDLESELEFKTEAIIADEDVFSDASDGESTDIDDAVNGEDVDKQELIEDRDLGALKLIELRALAKSRGVKGFSKMKKGDLVELLSGSLV